MGLTCNLNMGPRWFCKWFGDGTSIGSIYGSYVGLTRVLYGKLDQGLLLVLHKGSDVWKLSF